MKSIKPEKKFEQEVRAWCFENRIITDVFDSKAKYTARGIYKAQGLPIGTPDLIGANHLGHAIYIELKSPGKEAIPTREQYNYLAKMINTNCFACVTNSISHLAELYSIWLAAPSRELLISHLPTKVLVKIAHRKYQVRHLPR